MPLVNNLVRTTPAPPHDPTRRVRPPGHDPSPTRSTIPSSNGTDLPFPQSGNSGSRAGDDQAPRQLTAADLMRALDQTLLIPVAPSLRETDPSTVIRWVEASSEALKLRRERQRLIREVLNLLDDEWATAEAGKRLRADRHTRSGAPPSRGGHLLTAP